MAEQVRSRQLLQQIATLTGRVKAQRCVTTFLGSQEEALKAEIESLRKVCPENICQAFGPCGQFNPEPKAHHANSNASEGLLWGSLTMA